MRLLLDEMYSPALAAGLRARGHDVTSLHDRDAPASPGAPDAEVLEAARGGGFVLMTENVRDFRPLEADLVARGSHHAGLVYTTDRRFPRGDPATTGRLIRALSAFLERGQEMTDRSIFLPSAGPPVG